MSRTFRRMKGYRPWQEINEKNGNNPYYWNKFYAGKFPVESVLIDIKWCMRHHRDDPTFGNHSGAYKEYCRTLERSRNRCELAKLKKVAEYEDMEYTNPGLIKKQYWWFYD